MDMEGINPLGGLRQTEEQKIQSDAKIKREAEAEKTVQAGDKVEVAGGDVVSYAAQIEELPDVRSDKIQALQKEIAEGNYKVPSEQLADILIDELL